MKNKFWALLIQSMAILCSQNGTALPVVHLDGNSTFEKLRGVNKCWLEQKDVDIAALPSKVLLSERGWIRLHLMLVEKTLRARSTDNLSDVQKLNRARCLDYLHTYWQLGQFPVNDEHSFRTPIFIDKYDNFCAVGYLIKASGHENLSRNISATTNFAYVRQMQYPELSEWATENGFTVDELAWIQPSYPEAISPVLPLLPNGFNVGPKCMAVDSQRHKLYVGGDFNLMNTNQTAVGLAIYDIDSNQWKAIFPSTYIGVNAIQIYHNDLFMSLDYSADAGGYRVQYFDLDSQLRQHVLQAGALSPFTNWSENIQTFFVWRDTLYAGGLFTFQDGVNIASNVAKWNGSSWGYPGFAVPGQVNAFEQYQGRLIIGGAFDSSATFGFRNIVAFDGDSLKPVGSGLKNEVYSLKDFKGSLFAGCQIVSTADTSGLVYYNGTSWHLIFTGDYSFNTHDIKITTMAVYNPDSLIIGGTFVQDTNYYYAQNLAIVAVFSNQYYTMGLGYIDYGVNAIGVIDKKIYVAGDFARSEIGGIYYNVNGIGYCDFADNTPLAIQEITRPDNFNVNVFPNPISNSILNIVAEKSFNNLDLIDVTGRKVLSYECNTDNMAIELGILQKGIYLLHIKGANNLCDIKKIVVQ